MTAAPVDDAAARAGAERLRLAIVIPSLHGAGAERFLSEILPRLEREFHVDLVLHVREIDYPIPDGVRVTVLGGDASADRSLPAKAVRFGARIGKLAAHLARHRADVVLAMVDMNNVITWAASRLVDRRLPVVLAERTINERFFRDNVHARQKARLMRALLALAYRRADRVTVLSTAMRDYVGHGLGVRRPIDVVTSGVDLAAFTPPSPSAALPTTLDARFLRARLRLLNVARLDDNKDQPFLLRVLAALREERPEAELFIVGVGPNEARVRAAIHERGLVGRAHLLGWRTDVADYMRAADCFVLSSHHEGTPRTVIEAMACGLPSVATRSTESLPEVFEGDRFGFVVPVGDAAAFTAAVAETLRTRTPDHAFRDALAERARVHHDVRQKADRYVAILREAATAARR